VRAAEMGLGLAEITPHQVADDLEQWQPLLRWLDEPTTRHRPGSSRELNASNSLRA
jgi:hypothetical protein